MIQRDPDDAYQLRKEEENDIASEATRVVNAAREISPELAAAIDAARAAGHDDYRLLGVLKLGNDIIRGGRVGEAS